MSVDVDHGCRLQRQHKTTLIRLESDLNDPNDLPSTRQAVTPEISGKYLVFGLLILGICTTTLMFVYWEKHTKPFRSLREAIGREFRHSRPNVEGGRVKGRGPWTLRISMSVEFTPLEDTPKALETVNKVLEIIGRSPQPPDMEMVEVNLIQFIPQEVAKTRKFSWTVDELRASDWKAVAPQQ